MCRNDTLPKGGSVVQAAAAAVAASASAWRARPMPAADAGAEHLQELALRKIHASAINDIQAESRARAKRGPRSRGLLVDRRFRVEQQAPSGPALALVEHAGVAEARHVRAGVVGLGVAELAPGVFDDRLGRRAGRIGRRRAACRSCTGSGRSCRTRSRPCRSGGSCSSCRRSRAFGRLVAPGHAAAVLRQLLAGLPVADELAVAGHLDGLQVGGLDRLGLASRQRLAQRLRAQLVGCRPAAAGRPWRCPGRGTRTSSPRRASRRSRRAGATAGAAGQHAPRRPPATAIEIVLSFMACLLQRLRAGAIDSAPLALTPM